MSSLKLLRRLLLLGCGAFILLILFLVITGFMLPAKWSVRVEKPSAHPVEDLYPLISNFESWDQWVGWDDNSFGVRDVVIEGEAATTGHSYRWTSENSRGKLTITRAEANKGIWYVGAIESDENNASGSITLEPIESGGTLIVWQDEGDLPPGTGLLAYLMNEAMSAKLAEDLHRLHDIEIDSAGRESKPPPGDQ